MSGDKPSWMTTQEVVNELRLDRHTVSTLGEIGKIRRENYGTGKRPLWRYLRSDVEAQANKEPAPRQGGPC